MILVWRAPALLVDICCLLLTYQALVLNCFCFDLLPFCVPGGFLRFTFAYGIFFALRPQTSHKEEEE